MDPSTLIHGAAPGTKGENTSVVEVWNERQGRWAVEMAHTGRWLMKAIVLAGVASTATTLGAQAVRLGVVMDGPRQVLEAAWTDAPRQVERAYCVKDWSFGVYHISKTPPIQDDTVFRVFGIEPADAKNAGPMSVDFNCPPGKPELHVHTPTTCMGDDLSTCIAGGLNAYSCQPSRGDLEKLIHRGDEFGVLQCDQRAFRFYYPSEYAAPPALETKLRSPPQAEINPAMKPRN